MENHKYIFIKKYEHLKELREPKELFDLYEAARLMRHLLIDGLVDEVNKNARLQIYFEVTKPPPSIEGIPEPILDFEIDCIDPNKLSSGVDRERKSVHQFLGHKIIHTPNENYDVGDIIKLGSDAYGGKHHNPTKERLKQMFSFSESFGLNGIPSCLSALPAITRISVKGLEELYNYSKN